MNQYIKRQEEGDTDILEGHWYAVIWGALLLPFLGCTVILILSSVMYYFWRKTYPRKALAINLQGWLAFIAGQAISVLFFQSFWHRYNIWLERIYLKICMLV